MVYTSQILGSNRKTTHSIKSHIWSFAELLDDVRGHQGVRQNGAFQILRLKDGVGEVCAFQVCLSWGWHSEIHWAKKEIPLASETSWLKWTNWHDPNSINYRLVCNSQTKSDQNLSTKKRFIQCHTMRNTAIS